jgi:hypothetical protein
LKRPLQFRACVALAGISVLRIMVDADGAPTSGHSVIDAWLMPTNFHAKRLWVAGGFRTTKSGYRKRTLLLIRNRHLWSITG